MNSVKDSHKSQHSISTYMGDPNGVGGHCGTGEFGRVEFGRDAFGRDEFDRCEALNVDSYTAPVSDDTVVVGVRTTNRNSNDKKEVIFMTDQANYLNVILFGSDLSM